MASKTKLTHDQKILAREANSILKSISMSEWMEMSRPADKREELRYERAWLEANRIEKPQPSTVLLHHEELPNMPFQKLMVNFVE
jgi:hypothetical protein